MLSLQEIQKKQWCNEGTWLDEASELGLMMHSLKEPLSDRKRRLIACAWARRIWENLDNGAKATVEMAEGMAEGVREKRPVPGIDWDEDKRIDVSVMVRNLNSPRVDTAWDSAKDAVMRVIGAPGCWKVLGAVMRLHVRNPYRETGWDGCWQGTTAEGLAREMYEGADRRQELVEELMGGGVLGPDAWRMLARLEKRCPDCLGAGKDYPEGDRHAGKMIACGRCREKGWVKEKEWEGVSWKGCWVLDLILRKP